MTMTRRRLCGFGVLAAAANTVLAGLLFAQPEVFEPPTAVTVRGRVLGVTRERSRSGAHLGVHALLKTVDGEKIELRLGPEWFLKDHGITLAEGDEVEATGVRVEVEGRSTLVVATLVQGGRRLRLRDEYGFPVWRFGGRRRGAGRYRGLRSP